MNVHAVQFDIRWEDKPANFDRAGRLVASASPQPGSLIVLPEMFATGFSMNAGTIAEPAGGPTEQFLAELARDHGSCVLGGVVSTRPDGRGANQAVAFDPEGREIARYTKLHPFTHAGEDRHFAPGESLVTFQAGGLTIAPLICYDLRFPEAFRAGVRAGADCFVVLANWPAVRADHWRALLIARAIENQACIVAVNRIGEDPNCAYAGGSVILDAWGRTVAEAGDEEAVIAAALDPADVAGTRREFPVLGDILPSYDDPPSQPRRGRH